MQRKKYLCLVFKFLQRFRKLDSRKPASTDSFTEENGNEILMKRKLRQHFFKLVKFLKVKQIGKYVKLFPISLCIPTSRASLKFPEKDKVFINKISYILM